MRGGVTARGRVWLSGADSAREGAWLRGGDTARDACVSSAPSHRVLSRVSIGHRKAHGCERSEMLSSPARGNQPPGDLLWLRGLSSLRTVHGSVRISHGHKKTWAWRHENGTHCIASDIVRRTGIAQVAHSTRVRHSTQVRHCMGGRSRTRG